MPRKIAPQVGQALSRLLKGGYIKQPPVAYQAILAHPPSSLPARQPSQRPTFDSKQTRKQKPWYVSDVEAKDAELDRAASQAAAASSSVGSSGHAGGSSAATATWNGHQRNRLNSKKKASAQMPTLSPRPIVYLADRVRQRFYTDHPWEAFAPRTLVEGRVLSAPRQPSGDVAELGLAAWGRNPQPDDVVACTLYLHEKHGLSLSQAYHHTLSSYHALRAEHEHAAFSAQLEARAHGAVFTIGADGRPSMAVETERGFRKETEELQKGAAWVRAGGLDAAMNASNSPIAARVASAPTGPSSTRVKNDWAASSRGIDYLQRALGARDNVAYDGKASGYPPIESSASLLDQLAAVRRASGQETPTAKGGSGFRGQQRERQERQRLGGRSNAIDHRGQEGEHVSQREHVIERV